jgi:putative transposase
VWYLRRGGNAVIANYIDDSRPLRIAPGVVGCSGRVTLPTSVPALTATESESALAGSTIAVQMLTFKTRLLPSRGQHDKLRSALDHTRDLYNAALAERIDCYRKTGKGRSWQNQCKGLTELRADPAWAIYSAVMQRWPLKQVDLAFAAFFRRSKAKEGKAGFPRFRGREWFKTFGFTDRSGWRVTGQRLRMKGIGSIRLHLHRPLPSAPIACKVKREGRNWYALLTVEVPCATTRDGPAVGIDVGIATLAALSTGELIANARPARRAQREMRRRQRQLARCKRGSNRRRKVKARLASLHAKIARTRETHLHQVSASLASRFGLIAVEKLNIKGLAGGMLAKEVHDVAWGRLIGMLRYKAAKAGGAVIEVDPRYTSQICPDCGIIKRKELSERIHRCECGCVLDRDVAAAKVILLRVGIDPGDHNAVATRRGLRKICEAA